MQAIEWFEGRVQWLRASPASGICTFLQVFRFRSNFFEIPLTVKKHNHLRIFRGKIVLRVAECRDYSSMTRGNMERHGGG